MVIWALNFTQYQYVVYQWYDRAIVSPATPIFMHEEKVTDIWWYSIWVKCVTNLKLKHYAPFTGTKRYLITTSRHDSPPKPPTPRTIWTYPYWSQPWLILDTLQNIHLLSRRSTTFPWLPEYSLLKSPIFGTQLIWLWVKNIIAGADASPSMIKSKVTLPPICAHFP
jgi:hypothetical protein